MDSIDKLIKALGLTPKWAKKYENLHSEQSNQSDANKPPVQPSGEKKG